MKTDTEIEELLAYENYKELNELAAAAFECWWAARKKTNAEWEENYRREQACEVKGI